MFKICIPPSVKIREDEDDGNLPNRPSGDAWVASKLGVWLYCYMALPLHFQEQFLFKTTKQQRLSNKIDIGFVACASTLL